MLSFSKSIICENGGKKDLGIYWLLFSRSTAGVCAMNTSITPMRSYLSNRSINSYWIQLLSYSNGLQDEFDKYRREQTRTLYTLQSQL